MKIKFAILLAMSVALLFSGCTHYTFFAFKPFMQKVSGGAIEFEFKGSYRFIGDGTKVVHWGNPYYLRFAYVFPHSQAVDAIEIVDVRLLGIESGKVIFTEGGKGDRKYDLSKWRDKNNHNYEIAVVLNPLPPLDHENQTVSFTLRLFEKGKLISETAISGQVDTDRWTENRSK